MGRKKQNSKPGVDKPKPSKPGKDAVADDESKPSLFLDPDPPKPKPLLWISSGILMIAWMIFLLVVALRG